MEAVPQPEVRTSCTVDGHVLLACSVDGGDDVRLRWTSVLVNLSQEPAAQKSTGRTLYLFSSAPDHVICVAENPVSTKSSRPVVKRCRGRIPACIAIGLFACIPVCSMALLTLYKKPTRNSEEENIYVTMHGCQERTPENWEREIPETDDSFYVTRESLQATHTET
ncbi:hypothetical protein SKAU_G00365560 [Synaphobranchus kaupii]|uniref:Ig-like domain-containing protein n=1 Tax=Synaphobranchus kaupii TaxID=118154 RepID=A0A9Q1IEH0_SYNKA|nr:hypothetical protein SKAU_G00365560 [Synaphobranchus kaupii]